MAMKRKSSVTTDETVATAGFSPNSVNLVAAAAPGTDPLAEMLGTYNPNANPTDIFDNLAAVRYHPERNFNTEKPLITVPVRKPPAGSFFLVHPSPDYSDQFELVEDEGDFYFPSEIKSRGFLQRMLKPKKLFTCVDGFGDVSLWPIGLPGPDGRINRWNHTAMQCAEYAKTRWVSLQSNRNVGAYQPIFPEDKLPDPVWPDKTFNELLKIAFEPYLITDPDHPIVKRIRGKL